MVCNTPPVVPPGGVFLWLRAVKIGEHELFVDFSGEFGETELASRGTLIL